MSIIDTFRFSKYKKEDYLFGFKDKTTNPKSLSILNKLNIKGTKYYSSTIHFITLAKKPYGVFNDNVHLYFRARYLNSKTESLRALTNELSDIGKLNGNNFFYVSLYDLLKDSIDYILVDTKAEDRDFDYNDKRYIVHFITKDKSNISIEGYFVYDDESVDPEFNEFIFSLIKAK